MLKSIEEIYYIIDQLAQKILSKKCVKGRKQKLLLSELLTILVEGHRRGYITSKQIYALATSELRHCWRSIVDSAALPVNGYNRKDIKWANDSSGKSKNMHGWYQGFKLHLIINQNYQFFGNLKSRLGLIMPFCRSSESFLAHA